MPDTLGSIVTELLGRLGASDESIWKRAELRGYVVEGYDRLAAIAGVFWDVTYLEDQETTANITAEWERDYLPAGWLVTGVFAFTGPDDAEYAVEGTLHLGPTNHNHIWERTNSHRGTPYFRAVHELPDGLYDIERACWNNRRIAPLRSFELEQYDTRYELTNGEVMGYLLDKDGLGRLRKWKVPSAVADEYTVTGSWGLYRTITDVSGETVAGSWGVARRVPGQHPCAGPWGAPRRFYQEKNNVRLEYFRRGQPLDHDDSTFECPERYVKYIRDYAQARALQRNGPGQDLKLGAQFMAMWNAGVERAQRRRNALSANRRLELADPQQRQGPPPLAKMPWRFGKTNW